MNYSSPFALCIIEYTNKLAACSFLSMAMKDAIFLCVANKEGILKAQKIYQIKRLS